MSSSCFYLASSAALEYEYSYVEGVASPGPNYVGLHHAWVVGPRGIVFEVTPLWDQMEDVIYIAGRIVEISEPLLDPVFDHVDVFEYAGMEWEETNTACKCGEPVLRSVLTAAEFITGSGGSNELV